MKTRAYSFSVILLTGCALAWGQTATPASARPTAGDGASAATQPARDISEIRRDQDLRKLEQFFAHVKSTAGIEPAARDAIERLWAQRQADDDPRAFMSSALAVISKPFKIASDALGAGDAATASQALEPIVGDPDSYLSTHATMLMARALVEQDRLEEARNTLEGLHDRREELSARTMLAPEYLFLLGFCRLSNLDYDGAAEVFRDFEQSFPDAPDQYRLPVRQMLAELQKRKPDGLGDVSDLMTCAGRQLRNKPTGEAVRARQDRAVELLTKLIEDAEQQEQQQRGQQATCKKCGGKGCPDCQKGGSAQGNQQQPQKGADRSVLPPGQGRIGDLHASGRARPGEQWGQMRPEERERVLQALRQNFPSRYRQLVEQYYKQLSKEE